MLTPQFPIEEHVPDWCVPPPHAVQEAWASLGRRRSLTSRDHGVWETLAWVGLGDTSPLSNVVGRDRGAARAESWLALCVAADGPPPTASDWERLGVQPRAARPVDREVAFGVWRTLAWLLGVREDWPVYTSWHLAAELPTPHPHHYVREADRDEAWHVADTAAREQATAEARRWWTHIRRLADA
jgi:hypothetical protein